MAIARSSEGQAQYFTYSALQSDDNGSFVFFTGTLQRSLVMINDSFAFARLAAALSLSLDK